MDTTDLHVDNEITTKFIDSDTSNSFPTKLNHQDKLQDQRTLNKLSKLGRKSSQRQPIEKLNLALKRLNSTIDHVGDSLHVFFDHSDKMRNIAISMSTT